MSFTPDPPPLLAPLQRVMLRDSLAEPAAGHHVEQVEILFARGPVRKRVAAAWEETVARTAALRVAFATANGNAVGRELVTPQSFLNLRESLPLSWESWREADRRRPLLAPHEVPWRAVWWPEAGRFIWTFHHALLDGRSLARVLVHFFERLGGGNPDALAIAVWTAPTAEALALAEQIFREGAADPLEMNFPAEAATPAVRLMGKIFPQHLESMAVAMEVTAATILIWAWGQALMEISATDVVIVEQLRAGAPQPGTAGFTMNTLPVLIRGASGEVARSLREFRARLLALRAIESVSLADFTPGIFPKMDAPSSSVIMVERGTLHHLAGRKFVESLVLHEAKSKTLMATAHVLPELRLEVEGPGRHALLHGWIRVLERL